MITIKTSYLKALVLGASTDKSRYYINAVYFDDQEKKAVATDGHKLFYCSYSGSLGVSVSVPLETVKAALSIVGKHHEVELTQSGDDFFLAGIKFSDVGNFPNWKAIVVPESDDLIPAHYQNKTMVALGKVSKLLSSRHQVYPDSIYWIMQNGGNPARVKFGDDDFHAVIMPMINSLA